LNLKTGNHTDLMAGLRSGALDIAVSGATAPVQVGLIETRLQEEEAATIYAAANHRLAKHRLVTLADLAQERWVLSPLTQETGLLLTQAFANQSLPPPNVAVESNSMTARFHLVAASDLITFGSSSVAQHIARDLAIVALRVKVLSGTRRTCVTYRKDAYLPPVAFRFIEMLKKATTDMTKKDRYSPPRLTSS
jgi:DNA-binding transcriptional LysR family regulator